MSQECEICGKKPQSGNQVEIRGKAKYLGGVGTKVTGITRRRFSPNLQRVRVTMPNGAPQRLRVCVQCIRSGAIVKRVRLAPFRLPGQTTKPSPTDAASAKAAAKGKPAAKAAPAKPPAKSAPVKK